MRATHDLIGLAAWPAERNTQVAAGECHLWVGAAIDVVRTDERCGCCQQLGR